MSGLFWLSEADAPDRAEYTAVSRGGEGGRPGGVERHHIRFVIRNAAARAMLQGTMAALDDLQPSSG